MKFPEPHRPKCAVPGCSTITEESGLCHDHRTRWIVAGRPERAAWCVEQGEADAEGRSKLQPVRTPVRPVVKTPTPSKPVRVRTTPKRIRPAPDPGNCRVTWCGAKLFRKSKHGLCVKCAKRYRKRRECEPALTVDQFSIRGRVHVECVVGESVPLAEQRTALAKLAATARRLGVAA